MVKKSRSGSVTNIPELSESLEAIVVGKILKFFDPGFGIFLTLIRDPGWKNSDPG